MTATITTPQHPSLSLDLNKIRYTLIRLEDSIIFSLIERAQFAHNAIIYKDGAFEFEGQRYAGSFLQWFFRKNEEAHALARRYESPDEYSFTIQKPWPEPRTPLPKPVLPPLEYPALLHPNGVNANPQIFDFYTKHIVPELCIGDVDAPATDIKTASESVSMSRGNDLQYGSSATCDIECLQHISRRIHYGKFVAESKFVCPKLRPLFEDAIKRKDRQALDDLITDKAVEKRVVERLRQKAAIYGQEIDVDSASLAGSKDFGNKEVTQAACPKDNNRINADLVAELYMKWIIPLTKEVEIDYLLERLN